MLPLLERRSAVALFHVARVWCVVLAGNVVGALAFAWLIGRGDVFPQDLRETFLVLGRASGSWARRSSSP